jgi:DNA-binding XRE family transcriptional regulator
MDTDVVTLDFKALRKSKGYTQVSLAHKIGSSPQTISSIETHGYCPTYAVRKKVARALDVSMEDIWPGVDRDD